MNMTATELAANLNGIAYPVHKHLTKELIEKAKASGLVIVYGASDDLMEFDGAFNDEFDCWRGGVALVDAKGLLPERESIEDDSDLSDYFARKSAAKPIEALWCNEGGYSWTYKTDIPHATFDVIEDGEPYCRGIVFALADLQEKPNACADDFAKLFRSDDTGQVLVVLDEGDEGPEIRISFKPKGLGVCSLKIGFKDTDAGWERAEATFRDKVDEEFALSTVRKSMANLPLAALAGEKE